MAMFSVLGILFRYTDFTDHLAFKAVVKGQLNSIRGCNEHRYSWPGVPAQEVQSLKNYSPDTSFIPSGFDHE